MNRLAGVGLLSVMCLLLFACPKPSPVAPDVAGAACVSHRTVKQLECVDLYATRADIDACRAKVQAEIDCTKDGGPDGN